MMLGIQPRAGVWWRVVALGMLLAGAARADVSVGGRWFVGPTAISGFGCLADFTVTGSSLHIASDGCFPFLPASFDGTVDSAAGTFTVSGSGGIFCSTEELTGTVAPDGASFLAQDSCVTFTDYAGYRCGNGLIDAGEQCDDGNRTDGDCCSASCGFESAGTSCDPYNSCAASTCDGAGVCVVVAMDGPCDDYNACTADDHCEGGVCVSTVAPDGTSCDDGNACTTGETCSYGYCYTDYQSDPCEGCGYCDSYDGACYMDSYPGECQQVDAPGGALTLAQGTTNDGDEARWQWGRGSVPDVLTFGDPRASTSYRLCVLSGAADTAYVPARVMLNAAIPAGGTCEGKACWTASRSGYRYRDRSGQSDGITRVDLKAATHGRGRIRVQGRGAALGLGDLPAEVPLIAQLRSSDGACWEEAFPIFYRNDEKQVVARPGTSRFSPDLGQ